MRKIAVVTGSRADYGLLRPVLKELSGYREIELQVIATGMQLSPEFGLTYHEIEKDGFPIARKIETLISSDTTIGIAKSMGLGMVGFADAFNDLQPDILLLLGDRFEIFAVASTALVMHIPIAHIHGGELSEGAFDEAIRHSITKMSHWHFTATEEYRKRVIQLGEQPERVFNVGSVGVDTAMTMKLMPRRELEQRLGFEFGSKSLLVTFHPVTLEKDSAEKQMTELLTALSELKDTKILFTMPNADTGGRVLIRMINEFLTTHSNACAHTSLGHYLYFSCVAQVDAVVGNSSSGLIEVPSFRKPTVNIGDRQRGRVKAKSVIDCEPKKDSILSAIKRAYSPEMGDILKTVENPYGKGGAPAKIAETLRSVSLQNVLKKTFYDL